jgi:hypothetical protein
VTGGTDTSSVLFGRQASLTTYPIGRTPLQIHHRENPDAPRIDLVEKSVRKATKESAPNGASQDGSSLGTLGDRLKASLDILDE